MSILASIQNLSKSFGSQTLFKDISLGLFEGERMGLIGPNGTGKSTLLKIINGIEDEDDGNITFKKGIRVVYLAQKDSFDDSLTVEEAITASLKGQNWDSTEIYVKVQMVLGLAEFETPDQKVSTLSGGWRKRLALSRALVQDPDLLLMDEPTNHLDLEGIDWLEQQLKNPEFAFVVISHDRYFLESVANRIVELSPRYPEGYLKTNGNYSDFLDQREAYISEQEKKEETLSNKVRRETEWLRRGPKARSTKAKYRIQDAHKLQSELRDVKQRNRSEKSAGFDFDSNDKQSKVLIKAHNVSKSLGGRLLINKLNFKLSPGMRIGLLGRNGSGKSTLMKLFSGQLTPDEGNVKQGHEVKIVHFDQDRKQLDQTETVKQALSPTGGDTVMYRDRPIHVITWGKRFLFKAEQMESPVSTLSGGEQARILISRLMLQPADILLLDEPTNDLDIPSLEVLEQSLMEFPGAIVMVSHDRYLVDRVSTHILGLDGKGGITSYADLNQWMNQPSTPQVTESKKQDKPKKEAAPEKAKSDDSPNKKKKLTYKDQYALDHMDENIKIVETEIDRIKELLNDPAVTSDSELLQKHCDDLGVAQQKADDLYDLWGEIEAKL